MALEFSSLASGSSGNCQLIKSKNTRLLLDAGLSGKYIINGLNHFNVDAQTVDGILITHEHIDHIKGVGIMHRKCGMKIYANEATWERVAQKIGKIDTSKIVIFDNNRPFTINDIEVEPMSIAHDAIDPVAYSFTTSSAKISVITDLGHITNEMIDKVKDSDLLMLESNHNVDMLMMGKYPYPLKRRVIGDHGHLSNEACAEAAIRAITTGRVSTVLLAHLSKDNNTPELAYETAKSMFAEKNIKIGTDVFLDLTYRDRVGNLFRISGK
jgi:phosphoribosyl 1,2-cyclic phosphodiesterase